ncbi:mitochondrial ribosomal small subunit component [Orbilia oligospora]|uniref:37S ribosomal protein S25, mitochondrial n=1 Tax=Orbilia oligospora TaxID=2813651 RepID=A0A7C8PJ07_ORBOL|nr:mitochondrial ribosomal small subunit component [Orbilia oligospora]KAF3162408.1 mitochondrial ribosomal small subunit component [Orbilia oligospora]KAF3237022.1 mitochondrial ribosomal small subunit component [Orbilia oligospora]KAF3251606.1 mitochondrial ribosomal small subunit component [Orbilia oligospora]KAF3277610.1 mitochondrial ribosomal small subunit component [Orbilia oligospora]
MIFSQGVKPLRVYKETTQLLRLGILGKEPPWYQVVASVPPSTILIRTTPVEFDKPPQDNSKALGKNVKKKSKRFFRPRNIQYPEDDLRKKFFADHPWELARPRILVEDSGNDSLSYDWSKLQQPGRAVDGESVVQRQMWLMEEENGNLSKSAAYDVARKEFYRLRMRSDIERRIAAEEARSVGAFFGKTHLQVGLELEEKSLLAWKVKAQEAVAKRQQRIEAMANPGSIDTDVGDEDGATDPPGLASTPEARTSPVEPSNPQGP